MRAVREKMELFRVSSYWKSAKETNCWVCQRVSVSEFERGHLEPHLCSQRTVKTTREFDIKGISRTSFFKHKKYDKKKG